MAQTVYAGTLPGNDESAGFTQSYSKETLFCREMSPYRTPHVKDNKSSVTSNLAMDFTLYRETLSYRTDDIEHTM
jgi:hypothetical protein